MTSGIKTPPWWQILMVISVALLSVSSSSILVRLAIAAAGQSGVGFSLFLGASRLILASLFLLPTWRNISHARVPGVAYGYAMMAGVALAVHFATWITSLSYTSIAAATTLGTTAPIWVALLAWGWHGERPSRWTASGIAIACGGSMAIAGFGSVTATGSQPLLGNGLALIGAWTVSFYILWGQAAQRYLSITQYAAIAYSCAALVLLPMPWLSGSGYGDYPVAVYGYVLLMAIFSQSLGHTGINWTLRWISPTFVMLSVLLEPVLASLMGWWLFAEIPSLTVIIGGGLILLGVAIAVLGKRKKKDSSNA